MIHCNSSGLIEKLYGAGKWTDNTQTATQNGILLEQDYWTLGITVSTAERL